MTDILAEICAEKRKHIERQRALVPLSALEARIATLPPTRGFGQTLQAKRDAGAIGLIAEMKRASPSAGMLRPNFDAAQIAQDYAAAGAACLSVLTDTPYFQGQDEDVAAARAAGLPILRKDFMLDEYQVAEARAIGADCILLIVAALDDATALSLHAAARRYELDVLIEVHDADEMARALNLPDGMIGINNRNLKTLRTDLTTTLTLAPLAPPHRLLVSESGLRNHADLRDMMTHGVSTFLIGEHLLKQGNLVAATRAMLGLATQAP